MNNLEKLKEEITSLEKNTISDWTPVLIEHLVMKYDKEKLNIKPKYQRVFRWTKEQKSKFIESLLLWIPLPSIFVAEDEDWRWELVDWLQRISTILEFSQNKFFLEKYIKTKDSILSWLESWQYLKELDWITWDKLQEKYQNRILDTKIYVWIIKNTWDIKAKFELFQRLNTWGTKLSNQEVRNCLLVDKKEEIYNEIEKISRYDIFQKLIDNVKLEKIVAEENMELVLRCIALQNITIEQNIKIEKLIDDFIYKLIWLDSSVFEKTIEIDNDIDSFKKMITLIDEIDNRAFNKMNDDNTRKKHFIYPLYDTISSWIAYNIKKWNINIENKDDKEKISEKLTNIQKNNSYINWVTTWSSLMRLKFASKFWKDYFNLRT